jgi:putative ABC transport system permease protein
VLDGSVLIGERSFRLIGIDPVSLMQFSTKSRFDEPDEDVVSFIQPPGRTYISNEDLADLSAKAGEGLDLEGGKNLPALTVRSDMVPGTLMVDIGIAQRLLGAEGKLSRLLLDSDQKPDLPSLQQVVGGGLAKFEPESDSDLERLTDSFHLNLTAFGFMAFFVGMFIVYSAIGLAFEQRRPMIRTLRSCGVSLKLLVTALLLELLFLALFAGIIGVLIGYGIAAALLPDVAASLRGLYGARIDGELSLDVTWWLLGLGICIAGALLAAAGGLWRVYHLPVLSSALPEAWYSTQRKWLFVQLIIASCLFVIFLVLLLAGDSLVAGFLMMGCLLLGAALLQPVLLSVLLKAGQRRAKGPVAQWFWSDSLQQLSGLSFALMALLLALAVNIGVSTMVGSFRLTFTGWLDQRLVSEIYFNATSKEEAREIIAWLDDRPEVTALLPIHNTETTFRGWPTLVYGYKNHKTYRDNWPLLDASPTAWEEVANGSGALVSEQLVNRFDLKVGEEIGLSTATGFRPARIAGIFSDYGNPKGLIMIDINRLNTDWPDIERTRYGVRVDPQKAVEILEGLQSTFSLPASRLVDQASLKRQSTAIFEKTFAITVALNSLTLAVAGAALFSSLLTLSNSRIYHLAPLWAVGLTRRRLAWIELAKAVMLAALTAFVALPLGLLVSWCLVAVINVQAFGWRLPIFFFPEEWGQLFLMALLVALLASLIPVLQLRRTEPARLLKVFSDER